MPDPRLESKLVTSFALRAPLEGTRQWLNICTLGYTKAVDGREFIADSPLDILAMTKLPLLVDYDHDSMSGKSLAAGWVTELAVVTETTPEFSTPGIWGLVEWTPTGMSSVTNNEYKYLSPVLSILDSKVIKIMSVSLTNTPALEQLAPVEATELFSEQLVVPAPEPKTEPEVTVSVETFAAVSAEVESFKAQVEIYKAEVESYKKLNASLTAELETFKNAAFLSDIENTLYAAACEGKLPPATHSAYREFCSKSRENYQLFRTTILPNLPVVVSPTKADVKPISPVELPQTKEMKSLGFSEAQLKRAVEYLSKNKNTKPDSE